MPGATVSVPLLVRLEEFLPEYRQAQRKDGAWGKVHIVTAGVTAHDIAQGTNPEDRWPWDKKTRRTTLVAFAEKPCVLCQEATERRKLSGYV